MINPRDFLKRRNEIGFGNKLIINNVMSLINLVFNRFINKYVLRLHSKDNRDLRRRFI